MRNEHWNTVVDDSWKFVSQITKSQNQYAAFQQDHFPRVPLVIDEKDDTTVSADFSKFNVMRFYDLGASI